MQMFKAGDFVFKFDLKSGYHHISIYKSHWKYLGFAWNVGGEPRYYVFTVLPFGLATACYTFTKVVRPLRWQRRFSKSVPLGAPIRIQRSYDTESSEETEEKRPVTNDFVDTAVSQNSIDNYTRHNCKDFKVLLHVKYRKIGKYFFRGE